MIKILTIVGARPQLIKAAAVSRAIKNGFLTKINEVIIHTGQHYDTKMSEVFFNELEIPREKYNLGIGGGSHAEQTGKMMIEIEKLVILEKPDAVLLYGDTNSTLAGSLVAAKLHIPLIHVEAGVRTYNKKYPEEVNRIICDHLSAALFVPTVSGIDSLQKEGFKVNREPNEKHDFNNPAVFKCGDIMYDNTLFFLDKVSGWEVKLAKKYGIPSGNFILATMHRPSNVDQDDTLGNILRAFRELYNQHGKSIVIPLHPRTSSRIKNNPYLSKLSDHEGIAIIEPVSFLEMISLEKSADLIITDSGGVQKEAYFMEKPCLIMLEETPWPELIDSGNAVLVGSDYEKIVKNAAYFLSNKTKLTFPKLYGNGKAAEYICEQITQLNLIEL